MNISIGQYYPADSLIHRLDPRVKLLATVVYISVLFLLHNVWSYMFASVCVALVIKASRVPPRFMLRGLRPLMFFLVFAAFLNIFYTPGETVLVSFLNINITLEGIVNSFRMAARMVLLICGSSVMTLTTTPIQLTDAIEYSLKPLKKIGVPAHEIAMMLTIALRFIPLLTEEVDKIMKAQTARGADFNTGGLVKKAKSLVPLLVPLFISAFRRADDLATAMEARCYRGDINRTKMKKMVFSSRDKTALWVLGGFVCAVVLLFVFS